ncbi:restriction endonuclease subunit S [Paenibacillus sp. A14]|uniref:restriction endonuclease subunit S n=1 Tax=Paenibacillus sp. A14 TaxID=3119820 RepID=UPI002FE30406
MNKMKENVPKIRFPGFTGPWEQRRFDSVFDPVRSNTLSRADLNYDDGKIKNIHYGDILIKYGAVTDCGKDVLPFITGAEVSDYQSHLLQNGDVLIADAAEDATVGKATEVAGITSIPVISGLHTIACRPKVKMQPNFLGYYMNSPSYRQQLLPIMQGIKVLSISRTNLSKTTICYPTSAQEQSQIGSFFRSLDHLITLHQSKLNNVKNMKAGLLQKMFPKDGEGFPEVRFPGFTDAWEQRKLNDTVHTIGTGKSKFISNIQNTEGKKYAVLGSTSVISYDDEYDYSGDFVLTARVGANAGDLYRYSGNVKISDNTVFLQGKNLDFVFYSLTKFNLKNLAFGTGQPLIKASELSNLDIMFPSQIKEQNQVGIFFKSLDNLITLHQRKLEHLQEQKKALLQQMFV